VEELLKYGPSGAIILVVYLFLMHIRKEGRENRDMFANHLSKTYDQHARITEVLSGLRDLLQEALLRLRRMNEEK